VIAIFWIGFYPKPFLSKMETSVTSLLESTEAKLAAQKEGKTYLSNSEFEMIGVSNNK